MDHVFEKSEFVVLRVLFFGIFLQNWGIVGGNSYREVEMLTPAQREDLIIFKTETLPILPNDYMKEDIYLVKFLQFNNFTIHKSKRHLKQTLKWREDNDIDELIKNPPEYLSTIQKNYPIYVDGYDREDRPICEIPFGAWKVQNAANEGIIKKLIMHVFINCFEKASVKVREQQSLGKNVTQWIFLANMEGFNISNHVCSGCMPLPLNVASGTDRYYPLSSHGFWFIKTPDSFSKLFRLVRPVMSPVTRATTQIFGSSEEEWKPFLEKHVDFKEISDWYGGFKKRD